MINKILLFFAKYFGKEISGFDVSVDDKPMKCTSRTLFGRVYVKAVEEI